MDIHITYETLFDLLRKERSLEELQELDKRFWFHVIDYLKERQSFYDKTSAIEQEKMRIQLTNIKRILKEIYERREQKILQLALNVIRTDNVGFIDTRNMLYEERLLFDQSVELLKEYKTGVLEQVFAYEAPTLALDKYTADNEESNDSSQDTDSKQSDMQAKQDGDATGQQDAGVASSQGQDLPNKVITENTQTKEGTLLVKFVNAVPKFIGKDNEVFGPFAQGTITSLPKNIADILLKKEKVEKVISE